MIESEDVFCFRCPCGHPAVLSLRSPVGKYEGLLYRPNTDAWPLRLLCINCGQVTPRLQGVFESIDPMTLGSRSSEALWKVGCECAHQNCESTHILYASWPARRFEEELADKAMGAFVGLWCGGDRHEFCPKRETMKLDSLQFDPDNSA